MLLMRLALLSYSFCYHLKKALCSLLTLKDPITNPLERSRLLEGGREQSLNSLCALYPEPFFAWVALLMRGRVLALEACACPPQTGKPHARAASCQGATAEPICFACGSYNPQYRVRIYHLWHVHILARLHHQRKHHSCQIPHTERSP